MTPMRWLGSAMGLMVCGATCSPALAARFDYQIGLGVGHNDNVNMSETDPVSTNILEPSFGFSFHEDGATVQASVEGLLQYRDYLSGPFASEFRSLLDGRANWTMIPGRLYLTVEDHLGVQPIDQLAADTPANQQQTNVFAIGPTLAFRIGPTVRGQAELRYVHSYAEATDLFDSQRASAAIRAIKDLSSTSAISANLVDEYIDFKDDLANSDHQRYSAFGRYTRNWRQLDLGMDLGYSWLKYSGSGGPGDRSAPLVRTDIAWRSNDRSTFSLDLAYQYSDAASGMLEGSDIGDTIPTNIVTGDATITSQSYLERRVALGYAYQGPRATLGIAPFYRKTTYADSVELDQTGHGATLSLAWLLRPQMRIGINASGEKLAYDTIDRDDTTWLLDAFLTRQWTRHWSWRAHLTHYARDSTSAGQNTRQNVFMFYVSYAR